jgi:hypothetical protein
MSMKARHVNGCKSACCWLAEAIRQLLWTAHRTSRWAALRFAPAPLNLFL